MLTVVANISYAVSNTFICKHMIISGYKQVILLSIICFLPFREVGRILIHYICFIKPCFNNLQASLMQPNSMA